MRDLIEVLGLSIPSDRLKEERSQEDESKIDRLSGNLSFSRKDEKKELEDGEELILDFDLKSEPNRVLIWEGSCKKRTLHSLVQHTSKRHLYLCNDVLIVTTSSKGMISNSKYQVRALIFLKMACLEALDVDSHDTSGIHFQIYTPHRPYYFTCDTKEERNNWVRKIGEAIINIHIGTAAVREPGWQHDVLHTSLASSCVRGERESVEEYLKLDEKLVTIPDEDGMTPLHWAALRGHLEVVNLLLSKISLRTIREDGLAGGEMEYIDYTNNGLNTPLMCAAAGGHCAVFQRLLAAKACIDSRNLHDQDCLALVALYGHNSYAYSQLIQVLKDHNVNFNQFSELSGQCILHDCADECLPLQLLVQNGANINQVANAGPYASLTPLQVIVRKKAVPQPETLRNILDSGAFPNYPGPDGYGPAECILRNLQDDPTGLHSLRIHNRESHDASEPTTLEHWAQLVLPALMELTKKGARIDAEKLAAAEGVRDSFIEALHSASKQWEEAIEPPEFKTYKIMTRTPLAISKDAWVEDSDVTDCQLCATEFGFAKRKHHCRACGCIACATCSTKTLCLINESPDRVCDGCFNRLTFASNMRAIAARRATKNRKSAFRSDHAATSELDAGLQKNMEDLIDRQERLEKIDEASSKMKSEAGMFRDLTAVLLEQQKNRFTNRKVTWGSNKVSD